jgi:hypothetical protein
MTPLSKAIIAYQQAKEDTDKAVAEFQDIPLGTEAARTAFNAYKVVAKAEAAAKIEMVRLRQEDRERA